MYPDRYQLPALTAHVLAVLERRREGLTEWNSAAEAQLTEAATVALDEAGEQFFELADDRPYWQQVRQSVLTVALPRYLKLAKAEHALAAQRYGVWRGGDLISRVAYAAAGLLVAAIIWRTALPDWLEPLPLAFFVGGPLLPDLQLWFARRRYSTSLRSVVADMRDEAAARATYQPLIDAPSEASSAQTVERPKNTERN